jgi:hypothetical protein
MASHENCDRTCSSLNILHILLHVIYLSCTIDLVIHQMNDYLYHAAIQSVMGFLRTWSGGSSKV